MSDREPELVFIVGGVELKEHLEKRAEYHEGRKKFYLDKIGKLVDVKKEIIDGLDADDLDDESVVGSKFSAAAYGGNGGLREDTLRVGLRRHISEEKRFRFFASHIAGDADKVYRFTRSTLVELQFID